LTAGNVVWGKKASHSEDPSEKKSFATGGVNKRKEGVPAEVGKGKTSPKKGRESRIRIGH